MTKSKIFLYLCLVFILGVFIYSFFIVSENEEFNQYYGKELKLTGTIINEPEQRINSQKFEFRPGSEVRPWEVQTPRSDLSSGTCFARSLLERGLTSVNLTSVNGSDSYQLDLGKGKILVTTEIYPQYEYGDELEIYGKLQEPAIFEDFNYKEYLRKDNINLVMYYPRIEVRPRPRSDLGKSMFYQIVFKFKDKLRNIIEQTLLPPQSAVLKAIFLGDKFGLSNELKEKLNISGTRHIVAISGMHMIIMTQILLFLALGIGLWRKHAFYFVLTLLFLYILMIGAPASAVRAGIMAGLLLLAQKLGRLRSSGRAIVFAATIMLIFNPLLIKSDVGFQLSFVATLSIVYLKPILDKKIEKFPNTLKIKDIITMTLAAQLGTLPLLIYHFGRLSLISPIANLLIVPLLPGIMIMGMILVSTGLISLSLAKIIAYPVWFLLTYLIKVVEYASSVPLSNFEFKSFSLIFLIGYYLILIYYVSDKKN